MPAFYSVRRQELSQADMLVTSKTRTMTAGSLHCCPPFIAANSRFEALIPRSHLQRLDAVVAEVQLLQRRARLQAAHAGQPVALHRQLHQRVQPVPREHTPHLTNVACKRATAAARAAHASWVCCEMISGSFVTISSSYTHSRPEPATGHKYQQRASRLQQQPAPVTAMQGLWTHLLLRAAP